MSDHATLLKKKLWHGCFPVHFAKLSRVLFLHNTTWQLLYASVTQLIFQESIKLFWQVVSKDLPKLFENDVLLEIMSTSNDFLSNHFYRAVDRFGEALYESQEPRTPINDIYIGRRANANIYTKFAIRSLAIFKQTLSRDKITASYEDGKIFVLFTCQLKVRFLIS